MNIRFNLKSPSKEVSAIRIIITHQGNLYRKNTGLSIEPKLWNNDKQRCGNPKIDSKLKLIRIGLESTLDDDSSKDQIELALERIEGGEWNEKRVRVPQDEKKSFWEYFKEFAEKECPAQKQRNLAYNKIKKWMGMSESWYDIDSSYYFRLCQKMDEEKLGKNYQGTIIARLKTVMSEGYKLKLHTNNEFREFKKPKEEVFTIALSRDELDKMWNLEIKDEWVSKARDLFYVGVLTASRYEDCVRLSESNIHGKNLEFIQCKTKGRVVIPLSPKVREIFARNEGKAPYIEHTRYNRLLKNLGVLLKMNEVMQVPEAVRKRLKKKDSDKVYKYELLTGHCARRTGATLLYLSGVPMRQVMMITGHKSESSFAQYIRITQEENASILADNPLFR